MRNLYKKKIPKRTFHETVLDVLRLSPQQFQQYKNVAKQYAGQHVVHPTIKPDRKILPSTLQRIQEFDYPSEVAAHLHLEDLAHKNHSVEFHQGGGLLDATSSIFNSLWNTIGLGSEFSKWFGHFDYDSPENQVDDKRYPKIIQEAYQPVDERDNTLGDWTRDTELDNDEFSVWVDENDREVHVALRGTKLNTADLLSDLRIVATNKGGNNEKTVTFLQSVEDKYPDYKLDVSGHSLGGNTLIEVFNNNDLNYDRVNLFNPGTSPLADLTEQKKAAENDKYHFYLNSGDILSNTFASVLPSARDNVYWSRAKHSPLENHGVQQWV